MKVFDNLYYVGEKAYSSWAITTPAGIIIIDPIFDYSVEPQVVGGLRTLGLDPAMPFDRVLATLAAADRERAAEAREKDGVLAAGQLRVEACAQLQQGT